jgi:hypothetical protein
MADFDAQQPVRAIATQFTTEVANAAGTTINPSEDYAQGSTTSGQNGILTLGAVTTSTPTYSTGTSNPLSLDVNGNLRVTIDATSSEQNVNLNQVGGSAISIGQATMAASLPVVIASNQSAFPVTLTSTTITGTVAVTQSTSPWVVSLASTTITGTVTVAGNLTHNNAAPTATNIGVLPAVASTAAPTYTTGDQVLLSTDLAGNLRVTAASVALQNVNVTQWDSVALGAPSAYGTSPGAVNVIGVNAFVTNTVAENLTQVGGSAIALGQTTMSASLPVTIASNQSTLNTKDSSDGPVTPGAVAANSILTGGQFNTTLPTLTNTQQAALQVDSSGRLLIDSTSIVPTVTYATTASVASAGTATQTVNGPINLDAVHATASGEIKVVIAIGVSGSEATKWVGFTSASNKNFDWILPNSYVIPSGQDVKITITNLDKAAMDVYSSVSNH